MGFKSEEVVLQPATLSQLLQHVAVNHPERGFVSFEDGIDAKPTALRYPELLHQAAVNAAKLRLAGICRPGSIVVVYFESHLDNILWTWSVIAAGSVPAILSPLSRDPKTLEGQLENLRNLFGSPVILTRETFAPQFSISSDTRVNTVELVGSFPGCDCCIKRQAIHDEDDPDALAVLLFTSGSTGHSKAVRFTHRQLLCSVEAKKQQHSLHKDVSFMEWISFDHSAHFCEMHLNGMNLGSQQFLINSTDVIYEPHRFFDIISKYRIGYTFSPNSFLAAACKAFTERDRSHDGYDFNKLRVMMVAGEANRVSTMVSATEITMRYGAPPHAVKAAYGLSETSSACFYNMETPDWDVQHNNLFAAVGHPLPIGLELRIVDDELFPVQKGQQGKIQLRGDIVFKGYYNNEEANKCMTEDAWFDTGDIGILDEGDNLNIVGRSKEILIINGNKYSSFELEHAIESNELEHAIESNKPEGLSPSWTATFSIWDEPTDSEGVVVLFNPAEDSLSNKEAMLNTIQTIEHSVMMFCSSKPIAVVPLPRSEMPKSTIGKLSRQKLKKFYSEGHFDKYKIHAEGKSQEPLNPLITELQIIIASCLSREIGTPVTTLGGNSPIMHSGMNSIAYLRLKRSIEMEIGLRDDPIPLATVLESETIEDLEVAILDKLSSTRKYNPVATLQKGSKRPIFLLPPGGGEFAIWLPFLQYAKDRPVYALRAKGLERGEGTFTGMDDMLDTYEEAIRKIQPQGPYILLGLCFGGLTAFELAKRFEAAGDEVGLCGGLDNPPHIARIVREGNLAKFIIEMFSFHRLIPRDQVEPLSKNYEHVPNDEIIEVLLHDFRDKKLKDLGLTPEKLLDWARVNDLAVEICKNYTPSGRIKSYEIFWCPPVKDWGLSDEEWDTLLAGWEAFADTTTYHRIQGDHFTMLDPENVDVFQKALIPLLEQRGL